MIFLKRVKKTLLQQENNLERVEQKDYLQRQEKPKETLTQLSKKSGQDEVLQPKVSSSRSIYKQDPTENEKQQGYTETKNFAPQQTNSMTKAKDSNQNQDQDNKHDLGQTESFSKSMNREEVLNYHPPINFQKQETNSGEGAGKALSQETSRSIYKQDDKKLIDTHSDQGHKHGLYQGEGKSNNTREKTLNYRQPGFQQEQEPKKNAEGIYSKSSRSLYKQEAPTESQTQTSLFDDQEHLDDPQKEDFVKSRGRGEDPVYYHPPGTQQEGQHKVKKYKQSKPKLYDLPPDPEYDNQEPYTEESKSKNLYSEETKEEKTSLGEQPKKTKSAKKLYENEKPNSEEVKEEKTSLGEQPKKTKSAKKLYENEKPNSEEVKEEKTSLGEQSKKTKSTKKLYENEKPNSEETKEEKTSSETKEEEFRKCANELRQERGYHSKKNPTKLSLQIGEYEKTETVKSQRTKLYVTEEIRKKGQKNQQQPQRERIARLTRKKVHLQRVAPAEGLTVKKKCSGVHLKKTKLREGERNLTQRVVYNAGHLPSKVIVENFREEMHKEDNVGVEMADSAGRTIKERVLKPLIRKHAPFGFDRHQYKARKLYRKEKTALAKADIEKASRNIKASNPVSRALQKRKIKRQMYTKHGLRKSMLARIKGGAMAFLQSINPLARIKAQISAIIAGASLLVKTIIFLAKLFVLIIPVIVFINIFSIFFAWGGGGSNVDPNINVSNITVHYTDLLVTTRLDLIDAADDNYWPDSSADIVGINVWNVLSSVSRQQEAMDQLKIIAFLAAYFQDELTEALARDKIDEIFPYIWVIEEEYIELSDGRIRLNLSVDRQDIIYVLTNKLYEIEDPNHSEIAIVQFEQALLLFGLSQIGVNPVGNIDWRNSISSPFGYRIRPRLLNVPPYIVYERNRHVGLDIALPTGTPLHAIADGIVISSNNCDYDYGWRGKYVFFEIICPSDGQPIRILYAHCDVVYVSNGCPVMEGQIIARIGSTGNSTGPHLHIEMHKGTNALNPLFLLQFQ